MADIVHVSSLAGSPLLDSAGQRLGKVDDVVARIDEGGGEAWVVGLTASLGGADVFVPIDRIEQLGPYSVVIATTKLDVAPFERRPGEVLLRKDVLDRSVINVKTARLVVAREVEIVREGGRWRVAGIDPSFRPRLWRILPRRFRGHDTEHRQFVDGRDIELFVGHVPTSRLKLAARRILRLHPAQIADLVEAASHEEGEEILEAVGQDKELEADVFEELDDEHQVEFLHERSDEEAAAVLGRMESDDAADLLMQLDQERRLPILNRMPAAQQAKLRALLGHNPQTAGGMMNPDFISLPPDATVGDALARIRTSGLGLQQIAIVYVVDDAGRLIDTLSLAELVRADASQKLSELVDDFNPSVDVDADVPEVARLMSDYNLVAMPVLDAERRPVGLIAVDDVLELLVPEEWRRRAGAARD
ncbi:MAG TPA: CBS domain-containing protein [Solirubrobacteraceae bacterium]|nr:CBS domain-containing protein [Solirubrobacteraceae bacterium]